MIGDVYLMVCYWLFLFFWSWGVFLLNFNDFDYELMVFYIEIYGFKSLEYLDGSFVG